MSERLVSREVTIAIKGRQDTDGDRGRAKAIEMW